jgi:hypothetical protein
MKKLVTLLLIGIFTISIQAQKVKDVKKVNKSEFTIKADPNAGVFDFETEVLDYGTIDQNSNGVRSFKFTNTGKSPIIITRAKGSCGCTVPTVPKKPIMPGESAEIGVKYATNRVGSFSKSITLTSNASEKSKVIRIKGKVLKAGASEKNLEKPKSMMSAKQ